jgi:transcriptional regulator with XRE-family HTH domain
MESVQVCGERVRHFRVAQEWTQVELARRSGYSERVIRKAEAGGPISRSALRVIAKALSSNGRVVTEDDLCQSPVNIVRQFIESYDWHYDQMLPHCESLISSDFSFHSAGDKDSTVRGTWIGSEGWQAWLNEMKKLVERPIRGKLDVFFMTDGEIVAARYIDHFAAPGQEPVAMWVNLYFQIKQGKICRLDNHYDTALASRLESASRLSRRIEVS